MHRDHLTRRAFVNLVGRAGGVGAAYGTLTAMGLLAVPEPYAGGRISRRAAVGGASGSR